MNLKQQRPPSRDWKEFRGRRKTQAFRSARLERRVELELAAKFHELRLRKGISQARLAHLLGTRQSAIARLEGGRDNITISRLQKIADLLGAELTIRLKPRAG